jgi:ATP-binding cassette subfamily A (ABC1) protein 3
MFENDYFETLNSGLALGSMLIAMWEGNSVGIQWSNLSKTASPDDTLTIEHIIIMFFVDTIIYSLITWYVETVFPGEYGVPLPWYFPLKKSYWFEKTNDIGKSENLELSAYENSSFQTYHTDKTEIKSNAEYFEKEPTGLKSGIKITGLSKTFDKRKYAVKDLNLNAYRGQITALLGHNGAGIGYRIFNISFISIKKFSIF